MDFSQAEELFEQLKTRFEAGELSEDELKARLQDLMVQDEQGNWWVLGYESGRWYRHDGTNWVQADPPMSPLRKQASLATAAAEAQESEQAGKVSARPAVPGRSSLRKTPLIFIAATLIVLSIGGYYVLRSAGAKPATGATPTVNTVAAIGVKPTEGPTQTPEPKTQASQTPGPTGVSASELFVYSTASLTTLYQGPDLKYSQVGSYRKGAKFAVMARNPSGLWLLVRSADGNEGWLYVEWIDSDFEVLTVPTATFIPVLPPPTQKPKDSKATPCIFC